jgi:hypothetical protein
MKIGRNDPCSCGSGRKYKNCCLDDQGSGLPPEGPEGVFAETGETKRFAKMGGLFTSARKKIFPTCMGHGWLRSCPG